jgi:biotin transport system substrate-specific component
VPITGQTLGVLLSGAVLGSRRGALSQASYLVIGATGIPFWFALGGPIGIARLIGPTAGYLYGFIAMAFIVGWLSERGWDRKIYLSIPAMLAGEIALYFFGLNWLSMYVPSEKLLQAGLYPFIAGDLLKVMLAGSFLPLCCYAVNRAK